MLIVLFFTMLFAKGIGDEQNKINSSLLRFEDQVEVFATVNKLGESKQSSGMILTSWNLVIWNVGKIPLYLNSLEVDGIAGEDLGDIVLPASTGSSANSFKIDEMGKEKISVILHFTDSIGRRGYSTILLKKENGNMLIKTSKRVLFS